MTTRVKDDIKGEEGANPIEDANDRRVDMIVDGGAAQILAAHEFGHAFGLDDEYAIDPGGFIVGHRRRTRAPPPTTTTQTKAMTDAIGHAPRRGRSHENNADIMSLGNEVGAQHYSMFHAALCELTGIDASGRSGRRSPRSASAPARRRSGRRRRAVSRWRSPSGTCSAVSRASSRPPAR